MRRGAVEGVLLVAVLGFGLGVVAPSVSSAQPPPALVATPTAGLVDGDWIEVTGTNWQEGLLTLALCRSGVTNPEPCDPATFVEADVTETGDVSTRVNAHTRLTFADDTRLDCRVDACSLVATQDERFEEVVEVPLTFAPDGGLVDITISVTPDTGLHDGDVVQVTGEGRSGGEMVVTQCLAAAESLRDCDPDVLSSIGVVNDGFAPRREPTLEPFTGSFEVHRDLRLVDGRLVDCGRQACAVVVTEDHPLEVSGRAVIGFAGAPGPVAADPVFTG